MNCLICKSHLNLSLKFYELFLLKAKRELLCSKCEKTFPKISNPHCPRCYKNKTSDICKDCLLWEEKGIYIQHQAIFSYDEGMKEYFSNYKFQGDYQLRFVFSKYFKLLKKNKDEKIVPIPLSENRLQERGFNQVTAFLDAENISYLNLLSKSEQVKQSSLTRKERLEIKNPFFFNSNEGKILPKKVILIDDIYTTGSTLVNARQTLLEVGIQEVRSFSLCR
ncbi:MAG: ComF family protein [Lactovum sp.]